MATGADVRDILELGGGDTEVTGIINKKDIINADKKRSAEDLKDRYYGICAKLANIRATPGTDLKIPVFDAGHERRRKEQLERLYNRTPEQVSEEEYLIQELRKIESRKKERGKKAQDLQKLITAADTTTELRHAERKATKKKLPQKKETEKPTVPETAGIRFPDFKSAGVTLRSQRMKLQSSVGQKKIKALDQMLTELGVEKKEGICLHHIIDEEALRQLSGTDRKQEAL